MSEAFVYEAIRTPRGRVATVAAWRHVGLTPPDHAPGEPQPTLFEE